MVTVAVVSTESAGSQDGGQLPGQSAQPVVLEAQGFVSSSTCTTAGGTSFLIDGSPNSTLSGDGISHTITDTIIFHPPNSNMPVADEQPDAHAHAGSAGYAVPVIVSDSPVVIDTHTKVDEHRTPTGIAATAATDDVSIHATAASVSASSKPLRTISMSLPKQMAALALSSGGSPNGGPLLSSPRVDRIPMPAKRPMIGICKVSITESVAGEEDEEGGSVVYCRACIAWTCSWMQ
jgi:hypothetical protein